MEIFSSFEPDLKTIFTRDFDAYLILSFQQPVKISAADVIKDKEVLVSLPFK